MDGKDDNMEETSHSATLVNKSLPFFFATDFCNLRKYSLRIRDLIGTRQIRKYKIK